MPSIQNFNLAEWWSLWR